MGLVLQEVMMAIDIVSRKLITWPMGEEMPCSYA